MRSKRTAQITKFLFVLNIILLCSKKTHTEASPVHEERSEYHIQRSSKVVGPTVNTAR